MTTAIPDEGNKQINCTSALGGEITDQTGNVRKLHFILSCYKLRDFVSKTLSFDTTARSILYRLCLERNNFQRSLARNWNIK